LTVKAKKMVPKPHEENFTIKQSKAPSFRAQP